MGYAGFWKRFAAFFIDASLLALMVFLTVEALGPLGWAAASGRLGLAGNTVRLLFTWVYFAAFESSRAQATPGKMVLFIKVTDMKGNPIGFGRATLRYFAKLLSGVFFGIGFLMAAFTTKKQGLHDMASDCLVVNKAALRDGVRAIRNAFRPRAERQA